MGTTEILKVNARHIGSAGIYAIVNTITGMTYVGQAKHDFLNRWRAHIANLRGQRHHSGALQADWDQYGADVFEFRVLEIISPESDANTFKARELYHASLVTNGLYNVSSLRIGPDKPSTGAKFNNLGLITTTEVVQLYGIQERRLKKLVASGEIEVAMRYSGKRRLPLFRRDDVQALFERLQSGEA